MPAESRALVWLRRDLRLWDNHALSAGTHEFESAAVVFVFDRKILDRLEDQDDKRVSFIQRSVREIDEKLRSAGSQLIVLVGDPAKEIPKLAAALGVQAVVAGRDWEPYALSRDAQVAEALRKAGSELQLVKDQVVMEPEEILTDSGHPFKVFTPFSRAWRRKMAPSADLREYVADLTRLLPSKMLSPFSHAFSLEELGFVESSLWLEPGEVAAIRQLQAFKNKLDGYGEDRNVPSRDATSALSVHFRFGTVSIRAAFRIAMQRAEGKGAEKWAIELIWREFYQSILGNFPWVVEHPFQRQYDRLEYPGDPAHLEFWKEGRTGFPIVDAAMRCLNATGWMHNRLRMVVASFLSKDLLLDYRLGEAYFARKLLDFDLASNNGGWQWASSVGVDPQPYFRIFNPILQGQKFDPEGLFVRQWLPELSLLPAPSIHEPWEASPFDLSAAGVVLGETYPRPIVDHATQRLRAISLFTAAGAALDTP